MNDNIDFEKMMSEMAQLQREFDESARAAQESIRQIIAVQRFGGSAEVIDPEQVVVVAVDAAGPRSACRSTARGATTTAPKSSPR